MNVSASLAAALSGLTRALDEPAIDLTATLDQFEDAAQLAVSSYVGLSVHATVHGRDLGFTTLHDGVAASDITTSLRLELSPSLYPASEPDTFPTVVLILYATTPGAFVDLSADLSWLLGSSRASTIAVDENLTPPTFQPIEMSLAESSFIDQAIGVLIGRGHTPDQARKELMRLSTANNQSLSTEAEQLLAVLDHHPDWPDDLLAQS